MMTKRIFALLCLFLAAVLLFVGCAAKEKQSVTAEKEMVSSPLFQLAGGGERASFFALPSGFFYFTGREGGFSGGFVNIEKSISSEGVLEGEGSFAGARVFQTAENRAMIALKDCLFFAVLDENGSRETALPGGVDLSGALLYDSVAFLYPTDKLIVLSPVDFSETYVLCPLSALPDFGALLTLSEDETKIFYAKKGENGYTGYGYFEYGSHEAKGETSLAFDSFREVGKGKVLFCKTHADASQTFVYADLNTGKTASFRTQKHYYGFSCDEAGALFCGIDSTAQESGGMIDILRFSDGERLAKYEMNRYACSSDIEFSPDGKYVLFSALDPTDASAGEIVGYLDIDALLS